MPDRKLSLYSSLIIPVVFLLVFLGLTQTGLSQTPDLSNLTINSTPGANTINDTIIANYTLGSSSTTSVTAWYRNGQPTMSLFLPFEGGLTAALSDYSGNIRTFTAVNSPVWQATGGYDNNGAFLFSGTNYLRASDGFPTNSSYTITAWINRSTTRTYDFIVGSTNLSSAKGHSFRVEYDDRLAAGHNGNWRIAKSADLKSMIPANTWTFVAVTFDIITGEMILYKDGVPIDTGYAASNELVVTDPTVEIASTEGELNSTFVGSIDNVRIFKQPLSRDKIVSLYSSTGKNRIIPMENHVDDIWQARVTPFSSTQAGSTYLSNTIQIVPTPPVFTSAPNTSGIAYKKYTYDVNANGGPYPTFDLLSAPADMTIDPVTGIISWVPPASGSYGVTVSATNSEGSDMQIFTINVAEPSVGISNLQLQVQSNGDLLSTSNLTLNAVISATAWYKNSQPIMTMFMPFEGGPVYSMEDYSGFGNQPAKVGNPVWLPNGDRNGNGAYEFDGESFINVGNNFPLHSSYTKTIWFYHTVTREYNHMLSGWDHGSTGHGLRVSNDNRLSAGQNGDWKIVETPINTIELNRWYFGAVTFDYNKGEMILYLNGTPVDTTEIVNAELLDVTDPGILVGATRGEYAWKGRLDDPRVFDYVLTPEQIYAIYNSDNANIMTAGETSDGDIWQSYVTAFSSTEASVPYASNEISVGATNQPPTLNAIGPIAVNETEILTFKVSAIDPDLTFPMMSTSSLPANAIFVDSGNGAGSFTFTPSYSQAGIYNITFYASDGQAVDSEIVAITVNNINRPPVLAEIGNLEIAEGSLLNINVTATDPDNDSLTLSVVGLPDSATFVDNNNGTGLFSFSPDFLQAGTYDIWFRTFDIYNAGDSELVQITVTETPQNALWSATIHSQGEIVGTAVTTSDVIIGVAIQSQLTPASPAPPEYTTRMRLLGVDYSGPYYRDVRQFGEECNYWIIDLDPHGNIAPITSRCATLSWNPAEFSPDNYYVLREGTDPDGPIVVADMRTTTSYEVCDIET